MRRSGIIRLLLCTVLSLSGCAAGEAKEEKRKDLEFTVVTEEHLPQELRDIIEEKKAVPFKVTYEDAGWLYAAAGYGEQKSGGYSIQVNEFYETANVVYMDTNLLGPQDTDTQSDSKSYPYIVLKTEQVGKNVVFR